MRHQLGFTLIEVMVAFMVMAIGLLGVMGLQNTAIRNNANSATQMQAVILAKEMADLVRANPAAIAAGRAYNNVAGANITDCATSTTCTTAQMAQYDKWLWDARVEESIGAGAKGVVCVDASPDCSNTGDRWVVKLWWTDGVSKSVLQQNKHVFNTADLVFLDVTSGPSYYMSFMP